MKFQMKKPCPTCPFRTDHLPYLTSERVLSIAKGDTFLCHETYGEAGPHHIGIRQHCAGTLILHEKEGTPSQGMRVAERLGLYDRRKLRMRSPVYDTWEQAARAQELTDFFWVPMDTWGEMCPHCAMRVRAGMEPNPPRHKVPPPRGELVR